MPDLKEVDGKISTLAATLKTFVEEHKIKGGDLAKEYEAKAKEIVTDQIKENNKKLAIVAEELAATRKTELAETQGLELFKSPELAKRVIDNAFMLKIFGDFTKLDLKGKLDERQGAGKWKDGISEKECFHLFGRMGGGIVHKALSSTDGGGSGGEFITTEFGNELIDALRFQDPLLANLRTIMIPQGRKSLNLPSTTTRATTYAINQGTNGLGIAGSSRAEVGDSNPGTGEITWTPKGLAALTYFDMDMEDESRVDVFKFIAENLRDDLATEMAKSVYRGDTETGSTNINKDGGTPTTTAGVQEAFLAFNGLVKYTYGDATNRQVSAGAALAVSQIPTARAKGGRYMVGQNKAGLFMGIDAYLALVADSAVTTFEKYGTGFTNLIGELARVHGMPIFVTEEGLPLTDDDGKITSPDSGNDQKNILLVNMSRCVVGMKKNVEILVDQFPVSMQSAIIAHAKLDVQILDDTRGGSPVVYLYNAD